jgi:hypothetical protein
MLQHGRSRVPGERSLLFATTGKRLPSLIARRAGTDPLGHHLQGLDIIIATKITLGMLALSGLTNVLVGYCLGRFGRRFCFVYCK